MSTDAIDAVVELLRGDVGPQNGAKVVARAWVDERYRERLLGDANGAIAELGFGGAEGDNMVVVANTPAVHNMVVCTLCSCYPWPVLGLPPSWYKSPPYRARAVSEPRAVLREFGVDLRRRGGDPRLGLQRRGPLPRAADASGGNGWLERERARDDRHARLHDRHGRAERAGDGDRVSHDASELATVDRALTADAPLPRKNGELVFEEPWQGRALGMGVVALERTGVLAGVPAVPGRCDRCSRSRGADESEATAYYARLARRPRSTAD